MARYAPGIPKSELAMMTPEETAVVRKRVERHLADERDLFVELALGIMKAAGRAKVAI